MNRLKVAVIVPVYNVEKYIKDCLDSCINQTLQDIAIICVNDGSTDGSLGILKDYAAKYSKIHIINKPNGGLGAARNTGIKYLIDNDINPQYIYFVDSDDWLELDALKKLYNKASQSNSDVCIMQIKQYIEVDKSIRQEEWYRNNCYKIRKNDICSFGEIKPAIFTSCCVAYCHFYSYEFLVNSLWENGQFYPENLLFEDVYPHVKSLILAKRIAFLDECLYYYRIRDGSIMTSLNKGKKVFDIFKSIYLIENFLKDKEVFNELKDNFIDIACTLIRDHYYSCPLECKVEFANEAKEYLSKFDSSFFSSKKLKKYRLKTLLFINNPDNKKSIAIKNKIIYRFNRIKWSLGL